MELFGKKHIHKFQTRFVYHATLFQVELLDEDDELQPLSSMVNSIPVILNEETCCTATPPSTPTYPHLRNSGETRPVATLYGVQISSQGRSWVVRRSLEHFGLLDQQFHRCVYDRRFSRLPRIPSEPPDPGDSETDRQVSLPIVTRFICNSWQNHSVTKVYRHSQLGL